jgi:uncharacterized membrane protein YraQ (UPF0718 family)
MKKVRDFIFGFALAFFLVIVILSLQYLMTSKSIFTERFFTFTTIFLGIFIEAAPFLLLGTLASGLVEVFIRQDQLNKFIPRNPFLGALLGGGMGFLFPVCECGVVPLTRQFFRKGVPAHVGITFLLASPVINPIVIASTYAAYGWSAMFWLRIGLSLLIAVSVGLIFSRQKYPWWLLKPTSIAPILDIHPPENRPVATPFTANRIIQALRHAADEFFDMGRYLIIGSMLAALMQTFIPQTTLLSLGQGPFLSVIVMIALAVILSICSTVDAFISLAFVGSFTNGSILAFLVFGPMVDIKSTLMFLQVFRRRTVVYLIMLPLLMTILAALILNYYTPF